jgi:ABC-type multidrug transport system ATPase subunit
MIAVHDLSLQIGERTILDRIRFDVARGESVGLVGPNGSGKTSVLRALLGLVPFTGSAAIDRHDVVADPIAARERIGYLPQKPAFGDALAEEVLGFVARLRRIDRRRIAAVLEEVGLTAHARERARTFSGGMQQRLALGVALLAPVAVLLLDEPTVSLDQAGQERFYDIVAGLRRNGTTILLASHRSEEIDRLTDRVLVLDQGRMRPPETAVQRIATVLPMVTRREGK